MLHAKDASSAGPAVIPIYDTAEKIQAMPPCQATVGRPGTHWASFKTADGQKFCLGSPGATPEVRQFLQTLHPGQTYELPQTFLAYQQKQPQ